MDSSMDIAIISSWSHKEKKFCSDTNARTIELQGDDKNNNKTIYMHVV